jgi:hypothetical protein
MPLQIVREIWKQSALVAGSDGDGSARTIRRAS